MRILVVADEHPWPARTGYRVRLDGVLRALAAEHEVDLLTVQHEERALPPLPTDVPLRGHRAIVAPPLLGRRVRRLARWAVSGTPRGAMVRDWTAVRAYLGSDAPAYDVAWISHPETHRALADLVRARHVVDLDNLNSHLVRHRRLTRGRAGGLARVRAGVHGVADLVDERRWRRWERQITATAAAVVVCSDLDRRRLASDTVWVVPNGYERPTQPRTGPVRDPGPEPMVLFVGLLTYGANQDAAAFFAREVLPLVRRRHPGARFRVVGRHSPVDVRSFVGVPHVDVLGEVHDLVAELERTDVAVVPIRFGGGTRIKILEAWAYRLPLVSTTVGAEGLPVTDGQQLLLADDPEAFAAAVIRVLDDPELRRNLVTEGEALWEAQFRWRVIGPVVRDIVAHAAG